MDDKFLQSYLQTGLLEIGDDDDRFNWLKKSVEALQKKLAKDFSLLSQYTLVALDPNISENEQAIIDTESIVIEYWKALRGKYPETPRNIHRGVILNALYNVGLEDPIAARIIYLTGYNYFPFAKLNREKSLVEGMLSELGNIAEANAMQEWSLSETEPSLKLSPLKIAGLKFSSSGLNQEDLQNKLITAANNHHDSYRDKANWANVMGRGSAEAITITVNNALAQLTNSLSPATIEDPINKFFTDFKKGLDANLKTSFTSLRSVEMRSKLLWWKETLYSTSLKSGYRTTSRELLPIILAYDLYNQLPAVTPTSVDYLLRDTYGLLNNHNHLILKFGEYLARLNESKFKTILQKYFDTVSADENNGRIAITIFIGLMVTNNVKIEDFKDRTGTDPNETISESDLAVLILHDLLIHRLISE